MSISLGMEAIDFQHNSQAAIDLIKVFQDVIDYRNTISSTNSNKEIIEKVKEYVNDNMVDNFKNVVLKHFNLHIQDIIISIVPDCMFAVMPVIGTLDISMDIRSNIEGVKYKKHTPVTAKELEEVATSLDKSTAKIGKDYVLNSKDKKNAIRCVMYFDPFSAFLSKETIHVDLERFTAPSIAGIMLHEIGHVFYLIERANHTYQVMGTVNESLTHFIKYATVEEKFNYAKAHVNDVDEESLPNGITKAKLTTILENAEDIYIKTRETVSDSISKQIFSVVSTLLLLTLIGPSGILSRISTRIMQNEIVELYKVYRRYEDNRKKSDKLVTDHIMMHNERSADEFVSRHGLGSAEAKGLTLIYEYVSNGLILSSILPILRSNSYTRILYRNFTIITGLTSNSSIMYEKEMDRLTRLMQNNYAAMKQANLQPEILNHYIREHEQLEDIIKKHNRTTRIMVNKMYNGYIDLVTYFVYPTSILSLLTTGRLTKEYTKLMNIVDELSSSPLYYKAAKLSQLSN